MRQPHPTVSLFNPAFGDYCDIDAGISDLIAALWRNDIHTTQCCQEIAPGLMWIEFPNSIEAERFLDKAAPKYHDSVYNRAMGLTASWNWEYDINLVNLNEDIDDDGNVTPTDKGPLYLFVVSVRFPVTDYPLILANVLASEGEHDE